MYLVGAPHRHKVEAQILLERLVAEGWPLVTDAEVLPEEQPPRWGRLAHLFHDDVLRHEDRSQAF